MEVGLHPVDEGSVQLVILGKDAVAHQAVELLFTGLPLDLPERILLVLELDHVHALDLVAVFRGVGLLEGIVFQGDQHFLLDEVDLLQLQGRVPVFHGIGLLVVGAVVKREGEILLGVGHLQAGGVRQHQADVAAAAAVVIDHDPVHHPRLVVRGLRAQDIALDAVVEGPGRDLDLILGLEDVVVEGVDLVVGVGDEVVGREEGADGDQGRCEDDGHHHPRDRDAGGFEGGEFAVLGQLAHHHHRGEEGGERQGERQDQETAPHQELRNDLQAQSLADEFVDVEPERLHHQDEQDDQKDREERSYERLEYEAVDPFHRRRGRWGQTGLKTNRSRQPSVPPGR